MNFKLKDNTLHNICRTTGMSPRDISSSDVLAVDSEIEKKIGKNLSPSVLLGDLQPRGSVYLMFQRFFTKKEINKALDKI